ncbi:amino acid permease [Mycolicibacterium porcinum]|uniref:amino acid permease n=1 Tax=Mycolicibacterium porcinum TaxID=39693 RepID=UPI00080BF176|nr:amino acid permease [Mycolicibacterium porcinum]OCB14550.1 amino acid permease [Mycolicibacterium porcinum]
MKPSDRVEVGLTRQLSRRKPPHNIIPGEAHATQLKRSIGTFQLTMFGVGATIGTGIFFVLSMVVPVAGPSVIVSFIIAGIAAGLAAICYAELASCIPVSGSAYSYAYATLGELVAVVVAACLVLEYGVSTSATAVSWSQYLNKLIENLFGFRIPEALSASPFDVDPGIINLPAMVLILSCALLLIRGATESVLVNTIMVLLKVGVLIVFVIVGFTAFTSGNLVPFAPHGVAGIGAATGTIFFSYVGLDALATAGEEVKNPNKTLPRAFIYALAIIMVVYILVALVAVAAQPWEQFEGQQAGLSQILENIVGASWPGTIIAAGAVISIASVTLVTLYAQTRILFAMGRDGMVPAAFARVHPKSQTPVFATIVVTVIVALLAATVPLDDLADLVSIGTLVAFIVVSAGVILLRRTDPDLPRAFKVPGYPVTPILAILACGYVLSTLHWVTFAWFTAWAGAAVVFYLLWGRRHSKLATDSQSDNTVLYSEAPK